MTRESWVVLATVVLATVAGCESECRCRGEVTGAGSFDIACGGVGCVGGTGLRCVGASEVVTDPAGCLPPPVDGGTHDGGGPVLGLLGLCTSDADCEAGLHCNPGFPRPICTRACTLTSECGETGHCAFGLCIPRCAPRALGCDAYGGACTTEGTASYCSPTCEATGIDTTTCTGDLECDRYRGNCTSSPTSRGAEVGAPCTRPQDCRSLICFPEIGGAGRPTGWVGGMCLGTTRSRGPDAAPEQSGCPTGSVDSVGAAEGDITFCLPECDTNADCRPGYWCARPVASAPAYCLPIDCDQSGTPACPTGTTCQAISGVRRCVACTPSCGGRSCGPDGCGGSCGSCPTALHVCSAAGTCDCTGETDTVLCAMAGAECGPLSRTDRCGVARTLVCGTCTAPEACGAASPNQCDCAPETDAELCAAAGASCGELTVVDRCGAPRTPTCGACTAPATCGAITPNQCGCVAETTTELCAARGAECGGLSTTDRCSVARSLSCGSCTLPETCAGTGVANTCGICVPSCGSRICGGDGCGGSCGSCPAGQRCNASGGCEPIPCDPVANTLCGAGQRCEWTSTGTRCVAAGTGRSGAACFVGGDCAGQFTCTSEGMCREYCTRNSDCSSGVCALDLTGSPYGLCSTGPCDPTWVAAGSSGCPGFLDCRLLDTARADEFSDCGDMGSTPAGSSCTATAQCLPGRACVGTRCQQVCTLGTSCARGACQSVSGWTTYGICPP